ncbi:MAG: SMI1/KNR4 family protein [Thainema sp.]
MSDLADALEHLDRYLTVHAPIIAETLAPGLDLKTIEELTADLPFDFPDDLCELYQWHNGHQGFVDFGSSFIPAYIFENLSTVVDLYRHEFEMHLGDPYSTWEQKWLPLFSYESDYLLGVIGGTPQTPTQVVDFCREDPDYSLAFTSITSMMQTVAECFESGAFQILDYDEQRFDHDISNFYSVRVNKVEHEQDAEEAKAIYEKHNPGASLWMFLG